jgi:cell wall assembly regulator SMI1
MSPSVDESWERIEEWLIAHAPQSWETLNPPASPSAISALEHVLEYSIPGELAGLLMRHDGSGADWNTPQLMLPGGYGFMSTALIEQVWRLNTRLLGEADDPALITGFWWHPQWVPFAVAPSGDVMVVDQRIDENQGQIGHHLKDETYFETWDSLASMLADVADGLLQHRQVDGCMPEVADGMLEWQVPGQHGDSSDQRTP